MKKKLLCLVLALTLGMIPLTVLADDPGECGDAHVCSAYTDNGDGTHTAVCDVCGASVTEVHAAESYVSDSNASCLTDGTKHGQCGECGATFTVIDEGSKKAHSFTGSYFDNGDGTHLRRCTACDTYGAAEAHDFVSGVCVCGACEHVHTDENKDNFCDECECELYIMRRWDEEENKIVETYVKLPETAVPVTVETTVLEAGTVYAAIDDFFFIDNRITVEGTKENPTVLVLKDGCGAHDLKGIEVNAGSALIICGQNEDDGYFEVENETKYNAALGGGSGKACGEITVCGGYVNAYSYHFGAGIGGGYNGGGGLVTVLGGAVVSTCGLTGAGIGGGEGQSGGTILLRGGYVEAENDDSGAAIGGGNGGNGGNVIISGGEIYAYGAGWDNWDNTNFGAGIGGGKGGNGGIITINGGYVEANLDYNHELYYSYGAAIGGGNGGNGGVITINGGEIYAYSDYYGAGIGGGYKADSGIITINGGVIVADSDHEYDKNSEDENSKTSAAIGGGNYGSGTVTINGGTVTAYGDTGIGGGNFGKGRVTVNDGNVTAYGIDGSGIGGSYYGKGYTVTVNGGNVHAESDCGAGIGGGFACSNGTVTVNGGNVTAYGIDGSGIGGSYYGKGYTVTVNGGNVHAETYYGAGIGGGFAGEDGTVTITGGTVYAESDCGAGIGCGAGYGEDDSYPVVVTGGNVTVTGGSVTAQSKESYAIAALEIDISPVLYLSAGENENTLEYVDEYNGEAYAIISTDPVDFSRLSLTLDGSLGLNFYVQINSMDYVGDKAYMEMEFDNFGQKNTQTVYLKDLAPLGANLYRFTFSVNALQMAETVNATFYYGDGESITRSASVKSYAEGLIEKNNDAKAAAVAEALLSYGYFAQLALQETHGFTLGADGKYDVMDAPATAPDTAVDLSGYALTVSGSSDNITGMSLSLALENKTDIYLYVTAENEPVVTGAAVTVEEVGGRYRITVPNVAAHELATTYTLTVDGLTVNVSAFSYIRSVLASSTRSDNYKLAAAALYEYHTAAMAYAAS